MITKETVSTFKVSTICNLLGCDKATARKIKSGKIQLNEVNKVTSTKKESK